MKSKISKKPFHETILAELSRDVSEVMRVPGGGNRFQLMDKLKELDKDIRYLTRTLIPAEHAGEVNKRISELVLDLSGAKFTSTICTSYLELIIKSLKAIDAAENEYICEVVKQEA